MFASDSLQWLRRRAALGVALEPVSRSFGFDRGQPIDRLYIERFLERHAADIRGDVMEISDNTYTRRFGGERVTRSHVLSIDPQNPDATILADLARTPNLPHNAFDCIICTQTLQCILDVPAALRTLHRMLRPGGVLLVSVPGISQISRYDMDHWGDRWRFTSLSMREVLCAVFRDEDAVIETHGNAMVAAAFLYGLPASDLEEHEIDWQDRDYQLLITARAVKRDHPSPRDARTNVT